MIQVCNNDPHKCPPICDFCKHYDFNAEKFPDGTIAIRATIDFDEKGVNPLDEVIDYLRRSVFDNPGDPYCVSCWFDADTAVRFGLDGNGNLSCPNCGLVIVVKGTE